MPYTPLTSPNDYNVKSSYFAGKPVAAFDPGKGISDTLRAVRLECQPYGSSTASFDVITTMDHVLGAFWQDEKLSKLTHICLGVWGPGYDGPPDKYIEQFIDHADKLPNLKAFFCGDIGQEDAELSWVQQGNMTEFLNAFPNLEVLVVRGIGFKLDNGLRHTSLKHLCYESTSGLSNRWESPSIVEYLANCSFPQLRHLELWVNSKGAYNDLLAQQAFPNLEYLGVRNAHDIDDFCSHALNNSPQLATLKVLDLSGNTLTDAGATALLKLPELKNMELLDLHHHYVSEELQEKLQSAGISINLGDPQTPDVCSDGELFYYTMVSE